MTRYVYMLGVKKTFTESELKQVKEEICRLFDCTEITVQGGTDFTVHTPLQPDEAERALKELSKRFGAEFRGGVKMD